jgi:phosphoribosylanthranilate isomerase
MIVQIYEIQTPEDAEKCIELGVDNIGSVLLSQDTWRIPALRELIRLSSKTSAKNSLIPLFDDTDTLYRALDYYRPHYVHFCHGLTDRDGKELDLGVFVEFQARLKHEFPEIGIMRSVPVPPKGSAPNFPSLSLARSLEPVTDIFLTDTWLGKEPVKGYIGITGKSADWDLARELVLQSGIPVILAGGLSPDNVFTAIMRVLPAGADSCSLTNMVNEAGKPVRFKKDFAKVESFVREVRKAENTIRHNEELHSMGDYRQRISTS